jgi:hypothetical protein
VEVVYGEMNGVAPQEIVVHSRSTAIPENGLLPQEYLDAYAWNPGQKAWVMVFDATTFQDLANGGQKILEGQGSGVSQEIEAPLAIVDFAGDGTGELVLPVLSIGAHPGPLAVWILSWLSEAFTSEFLYTTTQSGTLTLNPDRTLTLKAGEYGPQDPACCPSQTATRVIGYDKASKKIKVLTTSLSPV